eukprot:41526_1
MAKTHVSFVSPEMDEQDSIKKVRASTEWDLSLNQHNYTANPPYRGRSHTHKANGIVNPLVSPRRSARPISMKRPLTERGNKSIQKMWVHSASTSVFSMHGMEAMLNKLNTTSPGVGVTGRSRQSSTATAPTNTSDSPKSSDFRTLMSPSMAVVMQPNTFQQEEDVSDWEQRIKKWETEGEWVECRETLTGRVMWYNSLSNRLVFDTPPQGVQVLPPSKYTKDIGPKPEELFLNRQIEPFEDEDIVGGLLQFDSHQWDFSNPLVDVYRAQAAQRDHRKMLPKPQQYCFPEYFSMSPLPELPGGKFLAKIRLPEEYSAHRRYSSVQIKVDYTAASDAIKQGVEKLDPPHNKERKDFILKVVGQEAFMYGRRKIIDYEAVRNAVRNENDVEFVLIKRKDFKQRVEAERQKQKEYEEHFKTAYPLKVTEPGEDGQPNPHLKYETLAKNANINTMSHLNNKGELFKATDVISLYDCEWHYRLKIEGLTNVTSLPRFDMTTMKSVYVVAELWMGDMIFDHATLCTQNSLPLNDIRWGQWLSSRNQTFSQIPRESILCFMVMAVTGATDNTGSKNANTKKKKYNTSLSSSQNLKNGHQCLAWCRLPFIDHQHRLRSGKYLLNLWEIPQFKLSKDGPKTDPHKDRPFRYRGVTRDKFVKQIEPEQCQLLIEFDEFAFDVIAPIHLPPPLTGAKGKAGGAVGGKLNHQQLTKQQKQLIASILQKTPLERLEMKEKTLIWQSRDLLWHDPSALPAFLRSVNWTNLLHIAEAHKYLDLWAHPKRPEDALEFLDYKFADTKVREKAIFWLEDLHDGDLNKILLQLVQCLKYEPHHNSALSRFLLERSLKNPYQIGHFFFWHLKAEYHDLMYCEKFGLLMEEYLLHAGQHSEELFMQNLFLKRLEVIAHKVQSAKRSTNNAADTVKRLFRRELTKLNRDYSSNIQMPVNPRWHAKKIVVEKCRYMSSKKVPLWLVFENADEYAQEIAIMFKAGDDLRQDMLTLQIITVMDRLWLDSKLDLHLKPYSVLATGPEVGMLQIVLNSVTVNTINMEYGGAFNETTIDKYLKKHNQYEQALKKARENFARSCAGYCVATCVLGIGDRHSDNYMVHQNGQFFHIDFGHFLGNFKSKFGIKRERSPLVFTPQMKFAIDAGAKKCRLYDEFLNWCAEAYNVLRARSRLLLVLFSLMVSAGLPELCIQSDIQYFKNMLNLRYEVKKATQHVHKQIASALKDKARLMDNHFHLTIHKA